MRLDKEDGCQQSRVEVERGDGCDEEAAYEVQALKKTSKIAQVVEQAVGLA